MPFRAAAFLCLLPGLALAQDSLTLTHQGFLLDASDQPVDGALTFPFGLYTTSGADPQQPGESVWTSTYEGVPVKSGLYALELGALPGTPIPTEVFTAGPLWLGVQVGDGAELRPRLKVASVPHALRATVAADAELFGGEAPAAYRDASRLTGVVPPESLGAGATTLRTLGVVEEGTWEATPIADDFVQSAAAWHGKLDVVTVEEPLRGTGVESDPLTVLVGTSAGTVAAGNDPRFTQLAEAAKQEAATHAAEAKAQAIAESAAQTDARLQGYLPLAGGTLSGPLVLGSTADTCRAQTLGMVRWNGTRLEACDGTGWRSYIPRPDGTQANPGQSCRDLRAHGVAADGDYWIDPDGPGGLAPFRVFCDMTTRGGGWTRVGYTGDSEYKEWFSGSDGWKIMPQNLPLALTNAQIDALRAVSTTAHQKLVARCHGVIFHYYEQENDYGYSASLRLHTGEETPRATPNFGFWKMAVTQDGCRTNGGEGGTLANATIFEIESLSLPVVNVWTRDNSNSGEKFGFYLADNPAWFR